MDTQQPLRQDIRILVVEDSPTQAERLRFILENSGYLADIAINGVHALEMLAKNDYTIVISDIIMPEMDGYTLCKKIKSDDKLKDIPVILLTTLSEPEDVIKGLECGADNFINKPYDSQLLLSRIHYILLNQEIRKGSSTEMGIEILFAGQRQFITSNRIQILDLLLSTYESAVQRTRELEKAYAELKKANETIKTLGELIPICARCKKIRDDKGYWYQVEEFIKKHTALSFTHGFCPDCLRELYPEFYPKQEDTDQKS